MLRSLFLLCVFLQVRKSLCAASDLAASISGGLSATGSSASGIPSAVLAMTIASRSSVLVSPANSFEAPCAASPGSYARGVGEPGARKRQRPNAAHLVDDDQRARVLRVEPVYGVFPVQDRLACQKLALARDDARPVRRLPDVEPYDDFWPSRWCHGGILQSSGRSEALPATPTLPGRGARARQFPSVVRSGERLRWQHPPGPLRGRGRRPSGGARSAAPRGLPVS